MNSKDLDDIQRFKILTLMEGIKLEGMGLKKRGRSCLSIAKSYYKIKGSRLNILKQLNAMIEREKQ